MKKMPWLLLAAAALVVVMPFFAGTAQDLEDSIDEPVEESDLQNEGTLDPVLTTIVEYGSLGTFLELLQESGLAEELLADGPVTVFAPDDSAFAQLEPTQLERLLSDRKHLKEVLSRHIVTGRRVEFGDGPETLTIKPLNGEVISVEVTEESVWIERAWVIDEQIECSNGVIHVIDAVLLPSKGQRKG